MKGIIIAIGFTLGLTQIAQAEISGGQDFQTTANIDQGVYHPDQQQIEATPAGLVCNQWGQNCMVCDYWGNNCVWYAPPPPIYYPPPAYYPPPIYYPPPAFYGGFGGGYRGGNRGYNDHDRDDHGGGRRRR